MEQPEVENSCPVSEDGGLARNRSFKTKQLVRSQAIRESTSPPRAAPLYVKDQETTEELSASEKDNSDTSSHSDRCTVISNDRLCDKKQPVEIQITSGTWESEPQSEQRLRTRRWLGHRPHSDSSRDLLSYNPRVTCVCGTCACPYCKGRRRKHVCPSKQDSGIVCSDDCPDCAATDHSGPSSSGGKKSGSFDADDQTFYCRCPERKEKPKSYSLSGADFETEPTVPELVSFIKETLNKNPKDRMTMLRIEKELYSLVNDNGRCIVRFPVMTSYGRMLVHRCAALFQLAHHLDHSNKTAVLVSKSGTSGGRIPCTSFRQWCTVDFPPEPPRHDDTLAKSILKRSDTLNSIPAAAAERSKSLEQREREYERVRRRIFSTVGHRGPRFKVTDPKLKIFGLKLPPARKPVTDNCTQDESQWPWLSGPVKLLTPNPGRNKLLKVQSLENRGGPEPVVRGPVSKSHSFGGYTAEPPQHRLLSRQGDLASSSWRLSPSSSGYKTLSLRSTDSVTPSPTGGASPEPHIEGATFLWAVTDMSAVPPGALVIHPQTGRPLTNPDGSLYHFDPNNPPLLYDATGYIHNVHEQMMDLNNEKRRGKLEKQHSFIDNDCECQPSEECRIKCCADCGSHDVCKSSSEQSTPQKTKAASNPTTPLKNHYEPKPSTPEPIETKIKATEYKPESAQIKTESEQVVASNQKRFESNQRSFDSNQRFDRLRKEGVYQQNYQEYSNEIIAPPQGAIMYPQQEQEMQNMMQAKVTPGPAPGPDPNIRPMSLTNHMVYQPAVVQQNVYPYVNACRTDQQPLQQAPVYQQLVQPIEEQKQMSPPHNETTFKIDPSYPYAADFNAACGQCDPNAMQQPRYNVPYNQVEVQPGLVPQYSVPNMWIQQPTQPYPQYQDQVAMQWQNIQQPMPISTPNKYMLQDIYPMVYPNVYQPYNIVYPQVIQQPYPIVQPVYPVIDKQAEIQRNIPRPKRYPSRCDEDRRYDEMRHDENLQLRIQQLKEQMAHLNTRGDRRYDWKRRNSGNGILGSYPNYYNGNVVSYAPHDDNQMSTAARAIVNSIRNLQVKNNYNPHRQFAPRPERADFRPRREEERRDRPGQLYRPACVIRQMSPGTWCRQSPGPLPPGLNQPRRPHPDSRNGRR